MSTVRLQTRSAKSGEKERRPSRLPTRQVWYALATTLSVIATIVCVAIATNPLGFFEFQAQPDRPTDGDGVGDQRAGRIVLQIDPDQCRQMKFDNVTGQIGEKSTPCEPVLDSHGVPVPLGTLHRLDAISKSFAHGGN